MPTGYTHAVQEGKITEFREFAMQCARAFGALILMRDDPADAPIPEEFKPSQWNAEAGEKAKARLAELHSMSDATASAEAARAHQEALAEWRARQERKDIERQRYEAMLARVRAWEPPSIEHVDFKSFMSSQLEQSIQFDCSDSIYDDQPEDKTGAVWHAEAVERAMKDIAYHAKNYAEEVARTEGRNQWVRQLRDSLSGEAQSLQTTTK